MGEKIGLPRRCFIVGAGEVFDYVSLRKLAGDYDFIICADGGYRHCEKLGVTPDLLVGDFDSIEDIPDNIPRLELPRDKSYTDSYFAVEKAIELGYDYLLMTGMLGGRLDHTVANLQLLARCARRGIHCEILDGQTCSIAMHARQNSNVTMHLQPMENSYFSVFAMDGACEVEIDGALYPLESYPLNPFDPRAVSNEFCGNMVNIGLRGGTIIIIATKKL